MRFDLLIAAFAGLASANVFGGSAGAAVYNKWHETELERWLSDHNIPYPAPADRKNLIDTVQANWDSNVVKPYNSWDINQLSNYLTSQGHEIKKGTEKNKDSLLSQVQGYWKDTTDSINDAYGSTQNWIFDSWTDSQLKSFLDKHGIPNPQPRTRDSLIATARANYQSAAKSAGETFSYPGDWLYESWSESDLKAWLDERGVPVPQPSSRDKLIAQVRRNSKIASDRASSQYASLSSAAAASQSSLSDSLIESWDDSSLKQWLDKAGIPIPQGSKTNELRALARKHSAQLSGNAASGASSASSYFGAATSSAGNYYAANTNDLYGSFKHYYDNIANNLGFASAEAKASLSSASSAASSSASSLSSKASSAASSASKQASKSGENTAAAASSAASAVSAEASSAARSASARAEL